MSSGLMFPKPRPRALEKQDRRKALDARDKAESAKVKVRSGGQCEVEVCGWVAINVCMRCKGRALHVHHLISGLGVRGIGDSALAENKVHCCVECHRLIHAHVLVPLGGSRFQRVT